MTMPCLLVVVGAGRFALDSTHCIVEISAASRTTGFSLGVICSAPEHMGSAGDSASGFARLPLRGLFPTLSGVAVWPLKSCAK
jgi:hypothetical protein